MNLNRLNFLIVFIFTATSAFGQFDYSVQTQTSEKGYLGMLNGQKLYYEVWKLPGAAGTATHSILLRTDTTDLSDSLDFWFDEQEDHNHDPIHITYFQGDSTISQETFNEKDIPTVFQILVRSRYGCQFLYNFNKPGGFQTMVLRKNTLTLRYIDRCRMEHGLLVTATFRLDGDRFEIVSAKSKQLKEIPID